MVRFIVHIVIRKVNDDGFVNEEQLTNNNSCFRAL